MSYTEFTAASDDFDMDLVSYPMTDPSVERFIALTSTCRNCGQDLPEIFVASDSFDPIRLFLQGHLLECTVLINKKDEDVKELYKNAYLDGLNSRNEVGYEEEA